MLIVVVGLAGCGQSLTDAQYLEKAKTHLDQGKVRAAVLNLKNALRKNPDNPEARFLLGKLYVQLEEGPAAEKELERAQELKIPLEAMVADYGESLMLQSKYQDALDKIPEQLGNDNTTRAEALAMRARALLGLGKAKESYQAVESALKLNPKNTEAVMGLARYAAVTGEIKKADEQAVRATKMDEKSVEAWLLRGEIERAAGNFKQSLESYTQAVDLNKYSFRAYLGRAQVALEAGDLQRAEADVTSAFKLRKKHPIAMYVQGVVDFRKAQYQEALAMFQKVSQALPNLRPVVFWMGLTNAALGNFAQAQDFASNYLKMYPNSVSAHMLMGYVELKQSNPEGALRVLASLEKESAQNGQLSNLLGTAYFQAGDIDKGALYLRQAAEGTKASPDAQAKFALALLEQGKTQEAEAQLNKAVASDADLIDSEMAFIDKLIRQKKYAEASKMLDEAQVRHPKDARLYNLRGGLALSQDKLDEAAKAFHKAMDVEPGFAPAAHNLALMALRKGNTDEARGYYLQVLKHQPDHIPTLIALYYLDKQAGKDKDALGWVEKANEKDPTQPVAATLLAREYLVRGGALKAVSTTEPAIAKFPKDAGLLEVRGLAQLKAGQPANAAHTFTDLVALKPNAADAYYDLAQAQAGLDNADEARKTLEKVLRLDPKHWKAKGALARLEVKTGHYAKAEKLAAELRTSFPKLPDGWLVEYELNIQQKKYTQAAQTMQDLMDKGDIDTDNVLAYARAQWAAGKQSQALDRVNAWLKLHDKDVAAWLYLATAQESLGQRTEAHQSYSRVLALAPDNALALNNLAWLLRDSDRDQALKLANKAHKLHPDSPDLADTLAVILIDKKDYQKAVDVLGEIVGDHPEKVAPTVRFHYAQALAKSGDADQAKRLLSGIVNIKGSFAEKTQAQTLLNELSSH